MNETQERLRRVLRGRLESLERAGVQQLPKAPPRVASIAPSPAASDVVTEVVGEVATIAAPPFALESPEPTSAPAVEPIMQEAPMAKTAAVTKQVATTRTAANGWSRGDGALFDEPAAASKVPASAAPTLEVLRQEVAPCTRCHELATTRTQTVFGVGNPQARLCFMGEAPGADEDKRGEPFVGRAGQLLDKIIEACQLKREGVYILNMLKCRPPGNRNPLPDELANCRPFLDRQLELIQPEFICCLGAVSSQNLLGVTTPIGKLRGKLHQYRGAKVVCTFHPAYLLRNPAAKKDCWDDMKFLMREMGVEL
jgi:uracil-DNA glycosylase